MPNDGAKKTAGFTKVSYWSACRCPAVKVQVSCAAVAPVALRMHLEYRRSSRGGLTAYSGLLLLEAPAVPFADP